MLSEASSYPFVNIMTILASSGLVIPRLFARMWSQPRRVLRFGERHAVRGDAVFTLPNI